jgi:hypothetical protein
MTKILGLSGKKQSGKSTTANWIIGQHMVSVDMVTWIKINPKGHLIVPAVVDGKLVEGRFDPLSKNPDVQTMLSQYVWPVVKLYSFADILKLSAMAIFGLEHEQVDGTNEQKDAPTKFMWPQFERFLLPETKKAHIATDWSKPMSGRHILQVMGTDIFRSIYGNVWVDACLKNVIDDGSDLAIITDCRFPNEVEGIQAAGGKVVRFLRAPFRGEDEHESETALDAWDVPGHGGFDYVFDNRELSIEQQNKATNRLLAKWGYDAWEWYAKEDVLPNG